MATKALRNKKCLYCERKFGKAEHLKRHQRAHTGEKPFKCAHCGREYARSDVLIRHVRNHHSASASEKQTGSPSPETSLQTAHGDELVDRLPSPSSQLRRDGRPAGSMHAQCLNDDNPSNTIGSQKQNTGNLQDQPNIQASSQRARPLIGPDNLVDRRAVAPLEGFEDWLGPQDLPLAANVWDDLSQFDFMSFTNDARLSLSPYRPRHTLHSPPKDNISDERYAKIASLWPTKKQTPRQLIQTLWRDVASFQEENIFSQPATTGLEGNSALGEVPESRWGLDEERRARLVEDCAPLDISFWQKASRGVEASIRSTSASDSQSQSSCAPAKFPSTQILDISLDVFFRRFHHLMPFIHEPTFSAKKTSSTLLFPMCLMGLTMLDSVRAKRFVISHLGDAIERCRRDLVVSSQKGAQLGEFLTTMAASVLLLSLAAINPKQPLSEHSRLLYNETINAAQQHGLFAPQEGEQLSSALFQTLDNVAMWRAWTRIESTKRLIVCLIMSDSFFSALDDHNPIIRTEQLHFYFPCKTELFQAATERRWSQMVDAGSLTIMPLMIPQLASAILPPASDASAIGFFGLFSTVWVRIVEARYRCTLLTSEQSNLPVPAEIFAHDEHAASIAPFLMKMWRSYGETMCIINPNCEAFWHHLNISMTADLGVFEIASGREGAESAKNALDDIATWSATAAARRACLHAAQIFSCMSKRRPIDGTSYEAEIALVHAALVLGLYVFVMPQPDETENSEQQQAQRQPEAFELLDQVDWNLVGEVGFTSYSTSSTDIDMGMDSAMCAAKGFIQNGGPISFSGVVQNGGYASARRVLLEYVYLLEDVGTRYNVMEFCHILRILSDALIDFDSGGAE
ncbi:uncharacterized protein Z520_04816 [Fonsecaea multimorphosa CBS 102226]|uniref:C2H2-type domain-containing protein n=1 Tax=Fonsecaea multimorphosa CBS 102226 TaxID=1442371 RepID=A0A0D2HBG5_9EURO|nr:uncharacterized protein Z520_04816 [Fonsecaea multimorphosa CBS 102226]KIX99240.1 hypothetical protein Z520_04816 [Fonsecaea multimorphosa CBS 102226]OAL25934.1 hypothetical protein AYO22_04561 [Fonsecaea multimorphosa]